MQAALDIYIKLLIAIISFIAPLLINLLSIFSDGIAVKKRKLTEFNTQAANLLKKEINAEGADVAKLVTDNSNVFKKRTDDTNSQLVLLDPKKQIISIFPTFFYSLLLIIVNRIASDNICENILPNKSFLNLVIYLSFAGSMWFAIKGVIILKRVVWAIIDVKQELAQENQKGNQQVKIEIETTKEEKENK